MKYLIIVHGWVYRTYYEYMIWHKVWSTGAKGAPYNYGNRICLMVSEVNSLTNWICDGGSDIVGHELIIWCGLV